MDMKKNLIATMCLIIMVFGVLASASADIIITSTTQIQWISQNPNPSPYSNQDYYNPPEDGLVISWVTSNNVKGLYKGNNNNTEAWALASSYATAFGTGNETATITYTGGDIVSPSSPAYLLVRDGLNASPVWYLFDLHNLDLDGNGSYETSWNGTETIQIGQFWLQQGSISHVALYGTQAKVPEPLTVILYGFGFAGAGLYRHLRRRAK